MKQKILSGGASHFEKVEDNLGVYFFNQADKFRNNVIQIHGDTGEKENFASIKLRSIRFAISLRNLGVKQDDIIVTCLKMSMNAMVPVISTMFLGAKFSAIDPVQSEREWTHCLSTANPKIIIVDDDQIPKLEKCLASTNVNPIIVVVGSSVVYETFNDLVMAYPEDETNFKPVIVDCHKTASILFSSGTTGLPKAIELSHFAHINQEINFRNFVLMDSDVHLLFSTYYWIINTMALVGAMYTGGCRVVVPKFEPENTLRIIQDLKVTSCLIPPSTARQILAVKNKEIYDTSSVRCFLSAGTSIPPEQYEQTRKLFKNAEVYNVYGSTELSGTATCFDYKNDPKQKENLLSVGKCIPDHELKIVDEETEEILGPNKEGEICVRSIYGMIGYLNIETSTKIDKDGFIRMGDRGYYDEDECIYLTGRCNENFKYGVMKVAPDYWESVLKEHPSIEEVGVFGIPHISDGFLPAACIVLKRGASASAKEIDDFFARTMTERHRLVGGIKFVKQLPKTPSVKLQRKHLLELFLNSP